MITQIIDGCECCIDNIIGSFQPYQKDVFTSPLEKVAYGISINDIYNYNTIIIGHQQNACSSNQAATHPKNLLSYVNTFKDYVLSGNNLFVMGEHSYCQDSIINEFLGQIGSQMIQDGTAFGGFVYMQATSEALNFGFPPLIASALLSNIINGTPLYTLGTKNALSFEYLGSNGGRIFFHTDSNYHYAGGGLNIKFFDEFLIKIATG